VFSVRHELNFYIKCLEATFIYNVVPHVLTRVVLRSGSEEGLSGDVAPLYRKRDSKKL
jgi:hypothetical protein